MLGKCLKGRRQDAVIATKFGFREGIHTPPYTAVQIDEAITRALRKLQTTYIDLLQVGFSGITNHPRVASSIPAQPHTFVEIDHEIISTVILLPSAESFKKGCCQLQGKVCARCTG